MLALLQELCQYYFTQRNYLLNCLKHVVQLCAVETDAFLASVSAVLDLQEVCKQLFAFAVGTLDVLGAVYAVDAAPFVGQDNGVLFMPAASDQKATWLVRAPLITDHHAYCISIH